MSSASPWTVERTTSSRIERGRVTNLRVGMPRTSSTPSSKGDPGPVSWATTASKSFWAMVMEKTPSGRRSGRDPLGEQRRVAGRPRVDRLAGVHAEAGGEHRAVDHVEVVEEME